MLRNLKTFFCSFIVVLSTISVKAVTIEDYSNAVYSQDVNAVVGSTVELPICLKNTDYAVKSFQFTVSLPTGVSFVAEEDHYKYTKGSVMNDNWTIVAKTRKGEKNNTALVMAYNNASATESNIKSGNQTVMSLLLRIDENTPIGACQILLKSITLTAADGSEHTDDQLSLTSVINIKPIIAEKVSMDKNAISLVALSSTTLVASILPDNVMSKKLVWSSSNDSVATVSQDGVVKAIKGGNAIISVKTTDGSDLSAQCSVTVTNPIFVVVYKVDGMVYKQDSVAYSTKINVASNPTKEGYTFSGWSNIPGTMPANNVEVVGTFTVNKYLLTYVVDGKVVKSDSVSYGSKIVVIDAPVSEGNTFSGWQGVPTTMPAKDVTISGTFAANKYIVTYMVDDKVYHSDTLAYGSKITLPKNPAKEGYVFLGWTPEVVDIVPANDLIYEAQWMKAEPQIREDVNNDGSVDTQDILEIYNYMRAGSELQRQDVNNDGNVDTQDVLSVYEYMKTHAKERKDIKDVDEE